MVSCRSRKLFLASIGICGLLIGGFTVNYTKLPPEPLAAKVTENEELTLLRQTERGQYKRQPGRNADLLPYTLNTSKCLVPAFDAIASGHSPLFRQRLTECDPEAKPFILRTTVRFNRTCPVVDYDALNKYYPALNTSSCMYIEIVRNDWAPRPDTEAQMGKVGHFKFGSCPPAEHVWIVCSMHPQDPYVQPLFLPKARLNRRDEQMRRSDTAPPPFNVLVLGIDALSRLNFARQMPKTRHWLTTSGVDAVELLGYNKIGENSAPNQIPMLTGVSYIPGLRDRAINRFFDGLTEYIWDVYERHGFSTMFFEEQSSTGLFVYPSMLGFRRPPTHYWPRPLMQWIDASALKMRSGGGLCLGPDYAEKHYLQYVTDALEIARQSGKPLFAYAWLSELSHDHLTGARRADNDLLQFFERLERTQLLHDTVILFLSDHGSRIEAWRHTRIGRYEDMMPFFYALMPPRLVAQRPDVLARLETNSRRLVTVYDVHSTLLELATPWDVPRRRVTANGLGVSLLSHEVPENRTCLTAGINLQFCACLQPVEVANDSPLALELAQLVIDTANAELDANNATFCARWRFVEIYDVFQLKDPDGQFEVYKVLLFAEPLPTIGGRPQTTTPAATRRVAVYAPNRASFEAAASRKGARLELLSRIERLDWYSSHAGCALNSSFASYCYCLV